MEIFRVPQLEIPARVLIDNGQQLEGRFFVPKRGPDGQQGRVLDRLNDPEDQFLPMVVGGDRLLLNKSGIVSVDLADIEHEVAGFADHIGTEAPVRITLAVGTALVGKLFVRMPPQRARVLDFLNAAERFLPLLVGEHVLLVQRSYVLYVRTLQEDPR